MKKSFPATQQTKILPEYWLPDVRLYTLVQLAKTFIPYTYLLCIYQVI